MLLQKSKPANGQVVEQAVTAEVVKPQEKAKPEPGKPAAEKKSNVATKKSEPKSKTQDKKSATSVSDSINYQLWRSSK